MVRQLYSGPHLSGDILIKKKEFQCVPSCVPDSVFCVLFVFLCRSNWLKSLGGVELETPFHAGDRGSNPLGDANKINSLG